MAEDKNRPDQGQGEIVIYQAEDGLTKVECRFVDETVWLTQQQMAELFHTSRSNIVEHIGHIYEEGELDESSTCRKFRQVRMEGNRQVARELPFYNLDMIISLGYRVKSLIATQFRRWATERLKEYMIKVSTPDGGAHQQTQKLVDTWLYRTDYLIKGPDLLAKRGPYSFYE